jgi:phosphatidylinositol glycan class Z
MFILYGPLALIAYISIAVSSPYPGTKTKTLLSSSSSNKKQDSLYVARAIVLVGLAFLSVAPHQEPRFLLPLLIPLVLLGERGVNMYPKTFWTIWALFNLILLTFFGVLHQAGVTYSLLSIGNTLVGKNPPTWIFFRTYMPPTFLTRSSRGSRGSTISTERSDNVRHPACQETTRIVDLNGSNFKKLLDTLDQELDCSFERGEFDNRSVNVVVPFLHDIDGEVGYSFAGDAGGCQFPGTSYDCHHVASFGPHLSTEDVPPFDGSLLRLYDAMVMGVYSVSCAGNRK